MKSRIQDRSIEDKLTSDQYINFIQNENKRIPIYKVEMLNKIDDSVEREISGFVENNSGNISISNSDGCRRTASISLVNYTNDFTDYFVNITLGSRFKVYLGYLINGVEYLFPQGVFLYSNPTLLSEISNKKITLSGTDKWGNLDGKISGYLNSTYQVNKGTSL